MGSRGRGKTAFGDVNDLPLEAFKRSLEEQVLWPSTSAVVEMNQRNFKILSNSYSK